MGDAERAALSEMNRATARLQSHKPAAGAQVESEYALAYQGLVRLGLAPQLRGKYRGRI